MLLLGAKACAQDWNSTYLLRISKISINYLLAFQCKTIQISYFPFLNRKEEYKGKRMTQEERQVYKMIEDHLNKLAPR